MSKKSLDLQQLRKEITEIALERINRLGEYAKEAATEALIDVGEAKGQYMRAIYNMAVQAFYNDYTPRHYQRRWSLIKNADEIFVYEVSEDPLEINATIDGSGMTVPYVYNRVFKGGWHGGSIGTPYQLIQGSKTYKRWMSGDDTEDNIEGPYVWPTGRIAKRMQPSPFDIFSKHWKQYDDRILQHSIVKHLDERGKLFSKYV